MNRFLALLTFLAFAPMAYAIGYQPPTLLPLIEKLEKMQHYIEKRVDPGAIERVTLPPVHAHYMAGLTHTKHPEIIYNTRRIRTGSGGLRDTLYAILADVTVQACASYKKSGHGTGKPYVVSSAPVKVAPNPRIIIEDTTPLPAGISCIRTPDDRLMFMMVIATRVKKPGQDSWRLIF